jgi:hypothetical protein
VVESLPAEVLGFLPPVVVVSRSPKGLMPATQESLEAQLAEILEALEVAWQVTQLEEILDSQLAVMLAVLRQRPWAPQESEVPEKDPTLMMMADEVALP